MALRAHGRRNDAMPDAPDSIAGRLRSRRTAAGLSLDALAAAAGISKTYLWELEADHEGVKHVSVDIAMRLANALAVPIGELVGDPATDTHADLRTVRIALDVLKHVSPSRRIPVDELAYVRMLLESWEKMLRKGENIRCPP